MKLREIYETAVAMGIENDPRGKAEAAKTLERNQKKFKDLKDKEKKEFDQEKLNNPYSDTRILYGDENAEVKGVFVGIDIEVGEILLAERLKEKGEVIDLIIAHHPEGKALAALHEVMHLQEDLLARMGVPINVAEGIMAARISEVKRGLLPINHDKPVDAARLMGFPFMCVHTPADNMVTTFLEKIFDEKKPETVDDVLKLLKDIPEFAEAAMKNAGPTIVVGSKDRRAGKIWVDMTGGTSGSEEALEKLSQAGVGTMIVMHIPEKHRKEAEKHHVNVIIAGHMASDSLGMNLFLDRLAAKGVKVTTGAGLFRVER